MSKSSAVRIVGDVAYVELSQGLEAIIDAEDVPMVAGFKWTAFKNRHVYYAQRSIKKPDGTRTSEKLHRRIMQPAKDLQVDHANGNGLDNRRANMRIVGAAENQWNSRRRSTNKSGFKGVHFHGAKKTWCAMIRNRGDHKILGYFETPEAAHAAYVEASKAIHGEYGRTK